MSDAPTGKSETPRRNDETPFDSSHDVNAEIEASLTPDQRLICRMTNSVFETIINHPLFIVMDSEQQNLFLLGLSNQLANRRMDNVVSAIPPVKGVMSGGPDAREFP